jgi:hypothetical protein
VFFMVTCWRTGKPSSNTDPRFLQALARGPAAKEDHAHMMNCVIERVSAADRKRAEATADELFAEFVAATKRAQQTLRPEDGHRAGKAWGRFLKAFEAA